MLTLSVPLTMPYARPKQFATPTLIRPSPHLSHLSRRFSASKPDLIVPGDDLASRHLHDLYFREKRNGREGQRICDLIVCSIGPPDSFPVANARASFMDIASQERIGVPKTAVVRNVSDLETWISHSGFPLVLKADGSSSGEGVKIVHTYSEAKRALRALQSPPQLIRVVKRALINRDLRWIRPALERRRSVVNAQEFIAGRDATSLAACWKGKVLAALHFVVINKQYERGPSSVLRLIENKEINAATERLVRRLKLSGLHGFDFLLEKDTEKPYLIEMNPRATQVRHLGSAQAVICRLL